MFKRGSMKCYLPSVVTCDGHVTSCDGHVTSCDGHVAELAMLCNRTML